MDWISIIITLTETAHIKVLKKLSSRSWRRLRSSRRHWPSLWHYALRKEDPTILELLFEHSGFNEPKPLNHNILHEFIQFGRNDLVKRNSAINTYTATLVRRDYYNTSAMITAVHYEEHNIAKTLLDHGASLNTEDNWVTTLESCLDRKNFPMARLFHEYGADPNRSDRHSGPPIFSAQSTDAIQLMMQFGAKLGQRDRRGYQIRVGSPRIRTLGLLSFRPWHESQLSR